LLASSRQEFSVSHRLGLAVKAVNLRAVQTARSDLRRVITQNAETNDHMVSINDRMGFRPVEVSAEFVKRLEGPADNVIRIEPSMARFV
jgi:hypothetical protein